MSELEYSVLRYAPSLVSGEAINLAAVFYYPSKNYREFFRISNWARVAAFDDSLNIPLVKDLMLDIEDEFGSSLTETKFDINLFCLNYDSKLFFDKVEMLSDVSVEELSERIEEVKRIYFQFEYDKTERPSKDEQKRFLGQLLHARRIEHLKNAHRTGSFNEPIVYDYIIGNIGIVFINLNSDAINSKTLNKVKAWAWNSKNAKNGLKTIIFYDLADTNRKGAEPAVGIIKEAAYKAINIHEGFTSSMLDDIE